ncbi:hypothetical protein CHARACLAT_033162 [Characodon lateralis]|uniref:Uncharacterized protein n=1 Tax=Characodon lateralis TaxID=208331 RepID=A0ABU7DDZ8_9TELE|nr:hypothetical protein [Characodon lateralis]
MDQAGGFPFPSTPGPRHQHTLFLHLEHWHLSSSWLAPSLPRRRQLNNPPSQVKTLNLSTPGGSCSNNLLVFPVPVLDYFVDNKNRKTFPSDCSLYVGLIYIKMTVIDKKSFN